MYSSRLRVTALAVLAVAVLLVAVFVGVTRGTAVLRATQGGHFDIRQFLSYVWQFYLPALPFMQPAIGPPYGFPDVYIKTFFGVFASLEVIWPPQLYDVLEGLSVAGLAAFCVTLARKVRGGRRRSGVVAVLSAMALILIGALHYAAYRSMLVVPDDPILVGRYLFPLVALYGVAIAFVVRELPRRASAALGGGVLAGSLVLGLGGIVMTGARFYA